MPGGWMHAVIDLIAYDRPYLEIHQWKDAPARWLGVHHRAERHDWYNAGKAGLWSLDNPTPPWINDAIRGIGEAHGDEAAEQYMVDLSHDHWDSLWDESSPRDRLLIEGFFAWVLFRPDILQAKFSVDVVHGRIQRQIDGVLRWEDHKTVLRPYRQLCRYVRRVLDNSPVLGDVVAAYETYENKDTGPNPTEFLRQGRRPTMSYNINLKRTAAAIADCWAVAEEQTRAQIKNKYWKPGEETITFMLQSELRTAISAANDAGTFDAAFASDVKAACPEVLDDYASSRMIHGLVGSINFHDHIHEGKRSGADLSIVIRRPSVTVQGSPPESLTIHDDAARALLTQAKIGKPTGSKGAKTTWRALTKRQRQLFPEHAGYYSLLLYHFGDADCRALQPFRWQLCKGHQLDEVTEWLRSNSFPALSSSAEIVAGVGVGALGTDDADIIRRFAQLVSGAGRVLEIRVGWPPGHIPSTGFHLTVRHHEAQIQQVLLRH